MSQRVVDLEQALQQLRRHARDMGTALETERDEVNADRDQQYKFKFAKSIQTDARGCTHTTTFQIKSVSNEAFRSEA